MFRACYVVPHVSHATLAAGVLMGPYRGDVVKPPPPNKPEPAGDSTSSGTGQKQPRSSWLDGPTSALPPVGRWPGERLGLPQSGVGAMAGYGPRIAALFIDWFASYAVALLLFSLTHRGGGSPWQHRAFGFWPWLVFVLEMTIFVALTGSSFGHTVMGLRVMRVSDQQRPSFVAAFMRAFFIGIVIPPVVVDRDGRGLHDRAVNTVLVRTRG